MWHELLWLCVCRLLVNCDYDLGKRDRQKKREADLKKAKVEERTGVPGEEAKGEGVMIAPLHEGYGIYADKV